MRNISFGLVALSLFLATAVQAQDDDLLAPLTPKKAAKPKKAVAPPKKKEVVEEPATPPIAPVAKTELSVKLAKQVKVATLFVDEREVGPLPQGPVEVSAGEHSVTVKGPGYAEWTRKVTAQPAKSTEVIVTLEPNAGLISVTADVPGAEVYVDGKFAGTAPLTEVLIGPGTREISVRKEGHGKDVHTVLVKVGKEYTVGGKLAGKIDAPKRVDLAPNALEDESAPLRTEKIETSKPLYQRWYFWAGIGVVVVGVAAGIYAATPKEMTASEVCDGRPCPFIRGGGVVPLPSY